MSGRLYPAILLFGMPGVGKGTQGTLLGKVPGVFHLSTGEIFRSLADDTDDGRLVANCLCRGQLVPDDLTLEVWKHWIEAQIESGDYQPQNQVLLLDGIPRTTQQCQRLSQYIDVLQLIYLNSPSDEPIIERLRQRALIEGRSDDADEAVIRQRLKIYRRDTAPILNYYPQELIREIDAMGTPGEVQRRILEVLSPVISAVRGKPAVFDGDPRAPHDAG